ncbi:DUF427 domain-containing protein [Streptomyces sp. NBC_01808]|uniref:DUF427 domain-containing protein n=1 Tax=Streptomyces sp. NBC_01808 TaxID=2975947 RepID=UPI002DDA2962|nr:DUF427 domain-containing protein [Streptomyces sp. NBC_01808]WSA42686.1 DUF427 domain-containing protein [Streptomyces sp. NBC_01808]
MPQSRGPRRTGPRSAAPPDHVHHDLRHGVQTRTGCPYKGFASYRTYGGEGTPERTDVAWSYEEPLPGAPPERGPQATRRSAPGRPPLRSRAFRLRPDRGLP